VSSIAATVTANSLVASTLTSTGIPRGPAPRSAAASSMLRSKPISRDGV
jgi:hypothetical protein